MDLKGAIKMTKKWDEWFDIKTEPHLSIKIRAGKEKELE